MNSSTSVKSNKVHPLLTDRSDQPGFSRKQGNLYTQLIDKQHVDSSA